MKIERFCYQNMRAITEETSLQRMGNSNVCNAAKNDVPQDVKNARQL